MAEYSSFYGGRQGAPFIIKKRFDAINEEDLKTILTRKNVISAYIDKNAYYEGHYCAVQTATDGTTYLLVRGDTSKSSTTYELIYKNIENKDSYTFKYILLDGTKYETSQYKIVTSETLSYDTDKKYYKIVPVISETTPEEAFNIDTAYFETMEEFFEKGITTTSIVNYGEYVLIDTVSKLRDKRNFDNGKVYVRGFEGGEFVGQIVGPEGETLDIELTNINDTRFKSKDIKEFNLNNGSLVPGVTLTRDGDEIEVSGPEHKSIRYKEDSVLDEEGNPVGIMVGLEIPYTSFRFKVTSTDPYQPGLAIDKDLDETTGQIIDHPFFKDYELHIPGGKKGVSLENVQIKPTSAAKGAKYYSEKECTTLIGTLSNTTSLEKFVANIDQTTKEDKSYGIIKIGATDYYVKLEDLIVYKFFYSLKNFENSADGVVSETKIDNYYLKTIKHVDIQDENFTYTAPGTGSTEIYGTWSSDKDENTRKFKIDYDDGESGYISKPINGIKDIVITRPDITGSYPSTYTDVKYKHLMVLYEDPAARTSSVPYLSNTITDGDGHKGYITGWTDLGPTNLGRDTLKVKLKVPNNTDISTISSNKPETILLDSTGAIITSTEPDPYYCGWVICKNVIEDGKEVLDPDSGANVVEFYFYDYTQNKWVLVGSLNEGLVNPATIIKIGETTESENQLNPNGIFFDLDTVYYAHD